MNEDRISKADDKKEREERHRLECLRYQADSYCKGEDFPRVMMEDLCEKFLVLADEKLTVVPSAEGALTTIDRDWWRAQGIDACLDRMALINERAWAAEKARDALASQISTPHSARGRSIFDIEGEEGPDA